MVNNWVARVALRLACFTAHRSHPKVGRMSCLTLSYNTVVPKDHFIRYTY